MDIPDETLKRVANDYFGAVGRNLATVTGSSGDTIMADNDFCVNCDFVLRAATEYHII